MKHFKANGDFCIVDVEPNWTDFRVFHENGHTRLMVNKEKLVDEITLPNFSFINLHLDELVNYEIIGLQSEIEKSEELACRVVEAIKVCMLPRFENYLDKTWCIKATESFQSLMHSLECYLENPIPKPNLTLNFMNKQGYFNYDGFNDSMAEYNRLQVEVSERLILKKV